MIEIDSIGKGMQTTCLCYRCARDAMSQSAKECTCKQGAGTASISRFSLGDQGIAIDHVSAYCSTDGEEKATYTTIPPMASMMPTTLPSLSGLRL